MMENIPKVIMDFAKACCPDAPDSFLTTGENNMLQTATDTIEKLRHDLETVQKRIAAL